MLGLDGAVAFMPALKGDVSVRVDKGWFYLD